MDSCLKWSSSLHSVSRCDRVEIYFESRSHRSGSFVCSPNHSGDLIVDLRSQTSGILYKFDGELNLAVWQSGLKPPNLKSANIIFTHNV